MCGLRFPIKTTSNYIMQLYEKLLYMDMFHSNIERRDRWKEALAGKIDTNEVIYARGWVDFLVQCGALFSSSNDS
jgi:hypothetical protein